MSRFSPERPVPIDTIVSRFSQPEFDLPSRLTTPSFPERVSRLLPVGRVPTYQAVTGPQQNEIADALIRMKILDPKQAKAWQEGELVAPNIDQLAISIQAEQVIKNLGKRGFGVWPVSPGISMADVNTAKLGMNLTRDQKDVLERYEGIGKEEAGLWISGRGLVANKSPLDEEYLPTLPEILYALAVYKDQEGHFPDSGGKWLLTSSRIALSLKDAYDRSILQPEAKDLFIEACIQTSPWEAKIRSDALIMGDFASIEPSLSIKAERSGDQYKLTDRYDTGKISFWTAGTDAANVLLPHLGVRILFNTKANGQNVTIADRYNDKEVKYESPSNTVLREINRERQLGANLWDRVFGLPIVFTVEPKKGVQIGVLDSIGRQNTEWTLAGGYLRLDYWPVLEKDMKTQLAGIELVKKALWPMIVPDSSAEGLLKNKR